MPDDTQPTQPNKQSDKNESNKSDDLSTQTFDSSATEISPEHVTLAAIEAESGSIADTSESTRPEASLTTADSDSDYRASHTPYVPPVSVEPPKKNKKGLIAAIISAILLIVLVGGGVAAYAWYQNPEKVVTDGIIGAIQAKSTISKGDIEMKADSYSIKVTYDTRASYEAGSAAAASLVVKMEDTPEMTLGGEAMYVSAGDVYVKAKDVVKTYDSYIDEAVKGYKESMAEYGDDLSAAELKEYRTSIDSLYRPLLAKIDNRWIKISAEDIKESNKDAGEEYECVQNALKQLTTDKAFAKQFRELYQKHKPLLIEQTKETKGNSIAYVIKENKNTSKAFTDDVADLPAIKKVNECTKSGSSDNDTDSTSTDSGVKTEVKVWADKWSHALTGFNVTADSTEESNTWNVVFNGELSFNKPVTITAPSDALSLKELKEETDKITEQFQSSLGSDVDTEYDTSYEDYGSSDSTSTSNSRT